MLRLDKSNRHLVLLGRKSMREAGYWERRDIQEMICRSPGPFCEELGEYIHIVGSEVEPTDIVPDRIDLLGIDPNGSAVVIEVKRDSHKLHLLQAISYAAMVSKWEPKEFSEELRLFNSKWSERSDQKQQSLEEATEELEEILEEGDLEAVNRRQRIILLAEDFDYVVLSTAEWLARNHEVDIRCYRLAISTNGNDDFLSCTREYPPRELTEIAIRRRRKTETGDDAPLDWVNFLTTIRNPAVVTFFRNELQNGRQNSIQRKALRFFVAGKRRYAVYAKRQWARVLQFGRFDDDILFWTTRLGAGSKITRLSEGKKLRFYLAADDDFATFKRAAETELLQTEFHHDSDAIDDELDPIEYAESVPAPAGYGPHSR
jgi:hypothetical protein